MVFIAVHCHVFMFQVAHSWQTCKALSQFSLCFTVKSVQWVNTVNMVGEKAGHKLQKVTDHKTST